MKGSALRHELVPSPNHDARRLGLSPSILLMHYTGMASSAASLNRLCDPAAKVSCHYLIDENGGIIQLVDEERRAWHAGLANWRGMTDVNSASIGVEIQNIGHNGDYPPFTGAQMEAVCALSKDVILRHGIRKEDVLAHSDVAPSRKADPGEKFDWKWLHRQGVGHWLEPAKDAGGSTLKLGDSGEAVLELQEALLRYGYGIKATGQFDGATQEVISAFQRHFRQSCVDGVADPATVKTLFRLVAALSVNSDGKV